MEKHIVAIDFTHTSPDGMIIAKKWSENYFLNGDIESELRKTLNSIPSYYNPKVTHVVKLQ